jgi:hypothetical protein
MTDYQLARRAIRIFHNYEVPHHVKRRYQRDWMRSVRTLGDKWFFAREVQKLTPEQQRHRSEDGTYRVPTRSTDASFRT